MKKLLLLLLPGIFALSELRAQWPQQSSSPSAALVALTVLNEDTLFVTTQSTGALLRSVDGGQNWDTLPVSDAQQFKIHFVDQQNGFIAGSAPFAIGPTCFKTADCGQTWQPVYDTIDGGSYFYTLHFVNKDTGFISKGATLSRTTDGGNTFTHQELISPYHYMTNITFISQTTGFVSLVQYEDGPRDLIFKTTDCGQTWVPVYDELTPNQQSFVYEGLTQMSFVDAQRGWAVLSGYPGKVLYTTDGGDSWQTLQATNLDLTAYYLSDIEFVTPQSGYLVCNQHIYHTADGGQTWSQQQTVPADQVVLELKMLHEQTGLASGHGIFKTSNGGTSIRSVQPAAAAGIRLYPNPAQDQIAIDHPGAISLTGIAVYDLSGARHEVSRTAPDAVSLTGLPSGLYYMLIRTNQGAYSAGFQIIR